MRGARKADEEFKGALDADAKPNPSPQHCKPRQTMTKPISPPGDDPVWSCTSSEADLPSTHTHSPKTDEGQADNTDDVEFAQDALTHTHQSSKISNTNHHHGEILGEFSFSNTGDLKSSANATGGVTSYDIFMHFVKFDDSHQSSAPVCDVSALLSRACFETWLKTRKGIPASPEDSFRKILTAHITGTKKRRPFPPPVEAQVLRLVRQRAIWPCFDGYRSLDANLTSKIINIGRAGFRAKGYHEQEKQRAKPFLNKPPKTLPPGFAVTSPTLPDFAGSGQFNTSYSFDVNAHVPAQASSATSQSTTLGFHDAAHSRQQIPPFYHHTDVSETHASHASVAQGQNPRYVHERSFSNHDHVGHKAENPCEDAYQDVAWGTNTYEDSKDDDGGKGGQDRMQDLLLRSEGAPRHFDVDVQIHLHPDDDSQDLKQLTRQETHDRWDALDAVAQDLSFATEPLPTEQYGPASIHTQNSSNNNEDTDLLDLILGTDTPSPNVPGAAKRRLSDPSLATGQSPARNDAKNRRFAQELVSVARDRGTDAVENLIRQAFGGPNRSHFVEHVRRAWAADPEMIQYLLGVFDVTPAEFLGHDAAATKQQGDPRYLPLDVAEDSRTLRASIVRIICHTMLPNGIRDMVNLDTNRELISKTLAWQRRMAISIDVVADDPRFSHSFRFPQPKASGDFDPTRPIGRAAFDAVTGQYFSADRTTYEILRGDVIGKCNFHLSPSPFFYWTAFRETAPLIVMYQRVFHQSFSLRLDGTPFVCRSLFVYRNGKIYSTFQDVTYLYPEMIQMPMYITM
ncbi:Hypothetical Protein FCC1311_085842 [Hondaea fermentalgiana]|uniref:Uncharacterized protein n=1 Tax=Hondaea fermentalgiana TaxID=2315210 RepID=A0A2R5GPY1_9STRA|nr:Hypothetical Protein FCC1311_085842 [Hondaea fermentalgiana]|eukprot:GBG32359.1 Hypothetical Protein FCC1311_085842 [Hondaea fermentalgiana]